MKIALVGSAPASVRNAPYGDASWKIFGCSPGLYGVAPRIDEWFETHLWEPGQPWFSPEYVQWLTALPGRGAKLWVGGSIAQIPGALVYPFDAVLDRYDHMRWFCSSSLFWMMTRAMDCIEDECKAQSRQPSAELDKIAYYGVDMAAGEEYEMQRAGIHYLTYKAAARGIEVGSPPESDLFTPRFRYGADEWTHSFRKIRARDLELLGRMQQAEAQARALQDGVHFLKGARENLKYMGDTWADKREHLGPKPAVVVLPDASISPLPVIEQLHPTTPLVTTDLALS